MEYSKTHCHFCNSKLIQCPKYYYHHCKDDQCFHKYNYIAYPNELVEFNVNGYLFFVKPNGMMTVHEPNPKEVTIDSALSINPDNYLEQVERMKKLQAFK